MTIIHFGDYVRYERKPSATTVSVPVNLVSNPTFDDGFDGWSYSGNIQETATDTGRDSPAAHIGRTGSNGNAALITNTFTAAAHRRYVLTAELKFTDVVWNPAQDYYKLRISFYCRYPDGSGIRHYDRIQAWGSTDWKQITEHVIAPAGTGLMYVAFQLSTTTGEFWVDNVSITEEDVAPSPAVANGVYNPVIIPRPLELNTAGRKVVKGNVTAELQGNATINTKFTDKWGYAYDWSDLTDEGYFVSTEADGQVFIGAKTAQGLYYGQQTLAHLEDGLGNVYIADVLDTPTLDHRGMVIGVQNYSDRANLIPALGRLKYNFVWNQGSFLNYKFTTSWRTPLNSGETDNLAAYVSLCNANHIRVFLSLSPRGSNFAGATTYSDPNEVQAAVDKLTEAYNVGITDFGLAFDDLQLTGQHVLNAADQLEYASLAEAHADFTTNVYNALQLVDSDITLTVVPTWYNGVSGWGSDQEDYVTTLNAGIPAAVEWVFVSPWEIEADRIYALIGKPVTVWDNFWASFYVGSNPAPTYVVPLDRTIGAGPTDQWAGYLILPPPPAEDSGSLMEWRTAADFAWAPDRYDKEDAQRRAVAMYLGVDDVPWAD